MAKRLETVIFRGMDLSNEIEDALDNARKCLDVIPEPHDKTPEAKETTEDLTQEARILTRRALRKAERLVTLLREAV